MDDKKKKDFALRISQANNVEMIIITYEIAQTYIEDALGCDISDAAYISNVELASKCIDELKSNLHYEYELAAVLKDLYVYIKSRLRDAIYNQDVEALVEVKDHIVKLKESYISIKDEDTSSPVMANAQTVVAGITYGKNQTLDELQTDKGNRGYLV